MMKKRVACICLVVVTLLCTACKKETYDWAKVDELMSTIGEENNSYFADGSLGLIGKKIDIYYNKDENAETFVRLQKWYQKTADDYYSLTFDNHYYDLVDNYIVTVQYTCSFHYADDVAYNVETADINVFEGQEENLDDYYHYSFYQVENRKMENGTFISCDFTEKPIFGGKMIGEEFVLPETDEKYFNELMTFGFEQTTLFLREYGLEMPY